MKTVSNFFVTLATKQVTFGQAMTLTAATFATSAFVVYLLVNFL